MYTTPSNPPVLYKPHVGTRKPTQTISVSEPARSEKKGDDDDA